jgi:peroxin-3
MKKREHFERTYSNSVTTFVSLLPTLRETISKSLNVDILTGALKERAANKLEIWEEMKCIAFSRVLASIYGCTLLNILLRIQLSVIGGYMIQDSLEPGGNSTGNVVTNNPAVDAELQHDYLAVAHYFVKEGMQRLCSYIYQKTKVVVGPISLKRQLSVQELEQILWHIIDLIRSDETVDRELSGTRSSPLGNYWKYIFPPDVIKRYDNFKHTIDPNQIPEESEDVKKQIMCETFDLLQSSDASSLATSFETHGVSHFLDRLVDIIAESQTPLLSTNGQDGKTSPSETALAESSATPSTSTQEINPSINYNHLISDVSIPLAKLIPIFNSFAPNNLHELDPFVLTSVQAETLRVFAANVYESFSSPISVPL